VVELYRVHIFEALMDALVRLDVAHKYGPLLEVARAKWSKEKTEGVYIYYGDKMSCAVHDLVKGISFPSYINEIIVDKARGRRIGNDDSGVTAADKRDS
jgi:hypothetical protein